MSKSTLIEQLHQCARDTKRYGTKYSVGEALPLEAAARIEALEAIVELLRQGPGDDEDRIHQTGDYQTGLHCGVEDRDMQADAYGAADYGFTEGVDAVLEWVNGIVPAAAQAAKEEVATK